MENTAEKQLADAISKSDFDLFCSILNNGYKPIIEFYIDSCVDAGEAWAEELLKNALNDSQTLSICLFNAVGLQKIAVCDFLLRHGANPNLIVMHNMDSVQRLIAGWQYSNNQFDRICTLLLDSGANPLKRGFSVASLAQKILSFGDSTLKKHYIDILASSNQLAFRDNHDFSIIDAAKKYAKDDSIIQYIEEKMGNMPIVSKPHFVFQGGSDVSCSTRAAEQQQCDAIVMPDYSGMNDEMGNNAQVENEEEESTDWEDYCDYPFAMEVVNGSIINLSGKLQNEMREKIIHAASVTEEDLINLLLSEDSDDAFETKLGKWLWENDVDSLDGLTDLFGFRINERIFQCDGIGFLDSDCGWTAKSLLEALGYDLTENIHYGPHGHGTTGVVYLEE